MDSALTLLVATLAAPAREVKPAPARAPEALLEAARAYSQAGHYDTAAALLKEGLRAAGLSEHCTRARLGAELGRTVLERASFRGGRHQAAEQTLADAVLAARSCGDPLVLAAALDAQGGLPYWQGFEKKDFAPARALYGEALALRRQPGTPPLALAESLFHVGLVHEQAGEHADAQRLYQEALAAAEAAGDRVLQSYAYRHLASYQEEARGKEGVAEYFEKSLALRKEAGWVAGTAFAHLALADALAEAGKVAEARSEYERAFAVAREGGIHRAAATAALALAESWGKVGEKEKARLFSRQAVEAAQRCGDGDLARRARAAVSSR